MLVPATQGVGFADTTIPRVSLLLAEGRSAEGPQGRAVYSRNDNKHQSTDRRPDDPQPGKTPTSSPRPDAGHALYPLA